MCREDRFCHRTGPEQGEAQQYRVAHASPDGVADVRADGNVLHKGSIDRHADNNEKGLESQRKQGAKVILSHVAALFGEHRCHRDRSNGGHEIDFYHSSECDDEDTDGECLCADTYKQGLEPQTKQRSNIHFHESCFQIDDDGVDVDGGIR